MSYIPGIDINLGSGEVILIESPANENNYKKQYFEHLKEIVSNFSKDEEEIDISKYNILFRILHGEQFYVIIEGDRNREEDGKALRLDWVVSQFNDIDPRYDDALDALSGPCSILEMMVSLAMRMNDILDYNADEDHTSRYFWKMLDNLEISHYTDTILGHADDYYKVLDILQKMVSRNYDRFGKGGLFPLSRTSDIPKRWNQNKTEIWYQMHAWVGEVWLGK